MTDDIQSIHDLSPQKNPVRRRLALLLILAGVALAGWYVRKQRLNQSEQTARHALEAIGGLIVMDANRKHPVSLNFTNLQEGKLNEAMQLATSLRYLKILDLTNQPITESHAQDISRLKRLTSLHVSGTPIDDQAVRHFSKLRRLETLLIARTNLTDEGVNYLRKIPSLVCLDLSSNAIQGDMSGISNLNQLQWLVAHDWTPSTAAIKNLGALTRLRRLTIDPDRISEEQSAELTRLNPQLSLE